MTVVMGVGALLFVFFIFAVIWASRYTKAARTRCSSISGRKRKMTEPDGTTRDRGFRVVKGGGTLRLARLRKGGRALAGTADD
jgi:uncharacterized membrane protein YqiK